MLPSMLLLLPLLPLLLLLLLQLSSWRSSAETAAKEKDFYYSKLRAIELLCNTPGIAGSPVSLISAGVQQCVLGTVQTKRRHNATLTADLKLTLNADRMSRMPAQQV